MIQGLLLVAACVCGQTHAQEAPQADEAAQQVLPLPSDGEDAPGDTKAPADTPSAAPDPAPEDEPAESDTPDRAARLLQLEELLRSFNPLPQPSAFIDEDAAPVRAVQGSTEDFAILSLRPHAKVTSDYIRIMDVVEFVEDPDEFEPFVSTIIVGPAPDFESFAMLSRDKVSQRLKEYGVPMDRIILTGAQEILILRTKALNGEESAREPGDEEPSEISQPAVSEGAPVLVIREGKFFRAEEWATANEDGAVGDTIEVTDRKDRTLQVRVTGPGTAVPGAPRHD